MEVANHNYIVFPETITGGWTGATRPDGTAFRLGEIQNVLADIGFVPGGVTLPELELRAALDRRDPTTIEVDDALGVIEAKSKANGSDGWRELADHRGGSNGGRAYVDFPAVDRGWLVVPLDATRLENVDRIGGVTWTESGVQYFEPSEVDAADREQSYWIDLATNIVLVTILRYQELSGSLSETVEACRTNPDMLYDVLQ